MLCFPPSLPLGLHFPGAGKGRESALRTPTLAQTSPIFSRDFYQEIVKNVPFPGSVSRLIVITLRTLLAGIFPRLAYLLTLGWRTKECGLHLSDLCEPNIEKPLLPVFLSFLLLCLNFPGRFCRIRFDFTDTFAWQRTSVWL